MREESQSCIVNVPAEALWDFLADYDKLVRLGWTDASARRLDEDGNCVSRFKARTVWEGIGSTYVACLEQVDRPKTLTWSTEHGGSTSWVRFDLDPQDAESARATATLHLKHGAAMRMLEPFAWGLMHKALAQTMERLAELRVEDLESALLEDRTV